MGLLGLLLIVAGGLCYFVGWLWFIVVSFQEHVLWGLACLCVPVCPLIFLILHFDKAARPALWYVLGIVLSVVGHGLAPQYALRRHGGLSPQADSRLA
jgi:hypothetical protein